MEKEAKSLGDQEARFARLVIAVGGNPIDQQSPVDVADQLEGLSQLRMDRVLLSWFDFKNSLKKFNEGVMPLLEKRGFRQRYRATAAG